MNPDLGDLLHRHKESARVLAEELSVPSVMFDGDHMDGEKFSMAQFQTRIDALMEMILEKKRAS